MLSVVMLSIVMLSVIIMLSVIMLSVIMLSVVKLSAVASFSISKLGETKSILKAAIKEPKKYRIGILQSFLQTSYDRS